MDNNEWINKHIDCLFGETKYDKNKLFEEKLDIINKPYYKYCGFSTEPSKPDYYVENLKENILYFQNPEVFNDPFDCFFGLSINNILKQEIIKMLKKEKKYNKQTQQFVNQFFENIQPMNISEVENIPDELLKNFITTIASSQIDSTIDQVVISEVLVDVFLENFKTKTLLLKLTNNQLTIRDTTYIVKKMYENESFRTFLKSNMSCDDKMLDAIKNNLILKIGLGMDNNTLGTSEKSQTHTTLIENFSTLFNSFTSKQNHINIDDIRRISEQISNDFMPKIKKIVSEQFKITCLSERWDSSLMWSHYTNKHQGFCLEYDFTHPDYPYFRINYPEYIASRLMLFPVQYSNKRPQITETLLDSKFRFNYSKSKKLPSLTIKNVIKALLVKSKDWEYEHEWRIIQIGTKTQNKIKFPKPTKIFLGCNISKENKQKLIEIAKKKNIPIYQMVLEPDEYRLSYYLIKP